MGSTLNSVYVHYIFSTKDREPYITNELRDRLFPFMGGILRKNGSRLISIGGTSNHVHVLALLPSTSSVSKIMQLLKGASTRWTHDTFPEHRNFAWQDGYAAFSVSSSGIRKAREYIENQEEHHRKRDFRTEYLAFLQAHDLEYDERYIWK